MDIYKPAGEVKKPLPVILDVHGGGLIAGRKEQNRNLCLMLAQHGYLTFAPDYSKNFNSFNEKIRLLLFLNSSRTLVNLAELECVFGPGNG